LPAFGLLDSSTLLLRKENGQSFTERTAANANTMAKGK
jgi:hypothetical protein